MENTTNITSKPSKNFIVRNVTLDALRKEISIDILTARNIIQQIQQKYNRKYFIIVNVGKNMPIALPFSVRLFQVVLFLLFQQLLR